MTACAQCNEPMRVERYSVAYMPAGDGFDRVTLHRNCVPDYKRAHPAVDIDDVHTDWSDEPAT